MAIAGVLAAGLAAGPAAQSAPAASAAKAKELAGLMEGRKIEAFAMRESPISERFFAVMLVPNVQILLVSSVYTRPSDIEYRLYHKQYVDAYRDLAGGALAKDKVFIEDVLGDGLVAAPLKNRPPDSITIGATRQLLDGPADPKKRSDTRMAADAYAKAFADADQRYAALLDALTAELKKAGVLVPAGVLR